MRSNRDTTTQPAITEFRLDAGVSSAKNLMPVA